MRTLAVLPIKRFEAAKQRLDPAIDPAVRAALAEAMLGDVLAALTSARGLDGVAIVTAEARAAAEARRAGVDVVPDTAEAGQSPAAAAGIAHALRAGYERVLLVPGDTPLLEAAEIDGLLAGAAAAGRAATIFGDRHGTGTNGLLLSPPDALEPSFGPGSLARHVAAARDASLEHTVERVPGLEHDVDTHEDLATLAARLDEVAAGSARRTRAVLAGAADAREPMLRPAAGI